MIGKITKKQIAKLPAKPGVYIFQGKNGAVLYVGKAVNLKSRVASHFVKPSDLFKKNLLIRAKKIDFILTKDENEALILEDQLIKKVQPKFNVQQKDDKSYFWVVATADPLPRVAVVHKNNLLKPQFSKPRFRLGPFVNGKELKSFLRQIRKIVPFRTCRVLPKKACLQLDLGNCPGYCVGQTVLSSGGIALVAEMLKIYQGRSGRLETYDISNIQGSSATGSLVVFKNNRRQPSQYRLFKIKSVGEINDPKMQSEIIARRLGHPEWPRPDLILLDGGKGQLSVVKKILTGSRSSVAGKQTPLLALAKKEERLYSPFSKNSIKLASLPREVADFFLHARDEAHRFAIKYHRQLRRRSLGARS